MTTSRPGGEERRLKRPPAATSASSFARGAALVAAASARAAGADKKLLASAAKALSAEATPTAARLELATGDELGAVIARHPARERATRSHVDYPVVVDPRRAEFSAWYEMFPRSFGPAGQHGTFADAERRLPYIASMGFDILYLPPIHPIGTSHRKGKNNSVVCTPDDVGSPWAIGAAAGGHDKLLPELGNAKQFRHFVAAAREHGLEVALDIAFQASPDHPWVKKHPSWFRQRPDGSIQYAENPPKKYQDIYPLDFESKDWKGLWKGLRDVFLHWIGEGIKVFRVDNPHTKSLRFWGWCISELKAEHPEVIFLAEAFTKPKLMYALAKLGFSQSYTYFTWRETPAALREYMEELTAPPVSDFFRPNFWPNTPDILPDHLQYAGFGAFAARLILAATLSGNYGIYGPAFELMDNVPRPGSGEYLDNEKYQLKSWDLGRSDSLRPLISRVNTIRRRHPALATNRHLDFHACDNDQLLAYSKRDESGDDVLLMVVSFDPHHSQAGHVSLDLDSLGLSESEPYVVHDLLADVSYRWQGSRNYVELHPAAMPAHIFHIRRS